MRGTKNALSSLSGAEKSRTSVVSLCGPLHQSRSIKETGSGEFRPGSHGVSGEGRKEDLNGKGRIGKGKGRGVKVWSWRVHGVLGSD